MIDLFFFLNSRDCINKEITHNGVSLLEIQQIKIKTKRKKLHRTKATTTKTPKLLKKGKQKNYTKLEIIKITRNTIPSNIRKKNLSKLDETKAGRTSGGNGR